MKIIRKLLTNKNITFLGIFLIVIVASSMIIPSNFMEGYQNISASNKPILDNFQYTGNKKVGNKNISDVWWKAPVFEVGSFTQVTNNLRYRRNPDNGSAIRSEMSDVLYLDKKQITSNISEPLPPAKLITPNSVRVNYYTTEPNLFLGQSLGPQMQAF